LGVHFPSSGLAPPSCITFSLARYSLFIQSHLLIRKYRVTATTRAVTAANIASKGNGTRRDYDKLLLLLVSYALVL
jgi:hypothetical protein